MKMIYQNDSECLPIIQKVGCFVRSCGIIAERKYNEIFKAMNEEETLLTAEQINKLWMRGKDTGIIDDNDNLINGAMMATLALRLLGDNDGRFIEIATKYGDEIQYYGWAKKKGYKADSFIQKIIQNGPSKYHFRVVDEKDQLIQDPHTPDINVVKPVYTICFKYVL